MEKRGRTLSWQPTFFQQHLSPDGLTSLFVPGTSIVQIQVVYSIHTFYTSRPTWTPGTVRVKSLHQILQFIEGRLDFICYTWFPFSWHEQANKMCYISQIILFPIFFISLRIWEKNLHNSHTLNSVTTPISTVNFLFHIAEKWLGISMTKDWLSR